MTGNEFGRMIRERREALGIDLPTLTVALGGQPSPGFLSNMEAGSVGPTTTLILKLGAILDLPSELMLNAAGYATETQRASAQSALEEQVRSSWPARPDGPAEPD